MDSVIEKNIRSVKEKIKRAAERSGQREEEIKLIAVTKNVAIARVKTAIKAGITDIGENKAQEALDKFAKLKDRRDISWHFVGHLQRNKVKLVVDFVDLIQSVDSMRLAEEIDRRARKKSKIQNILVQLNVAEEATKFGLRKEEIGEFLRTISCLKNLQVKGLMAIAPLVNDTRKVQPVFAEMKMLFEGLRRDKIPGIELEYLSMGMTNDFEVAIESGANMIRVGTGIFGDAI